MHQSYGAERTAISRLTQHPPSLDCLNSACEVSFGYVEPLDIRGDCSDNRLGLGRFLLNNSDLVHEMLHGHSGQKVADKSS